MPDDKIVVPGTNLKLPLDLDLSRRDILKIAGYGSLAAFIAACGGSTPGTSTSVTAKGGTMSLGSYQSDSVPKKALADLVTSFTSANGGTKVNINTVDHGTFQNQITSYLQGTPEDVFTWFSGHRMRFFASKGLASPIDDVWNAVKGNYTEGFANSVKGDDGHVYAIPTSYYPWAVFYRKDVFAAHNYTIPTNWDEFKALCTKMKSDGLTPIAFADKDGWPAMGTFDILNLRMNGYDFHVGLCTGQQKWSDPKVTAVFKKWAEITPFYSPAFAGLTKYDPLTKKAADIVSKAKKITQFFDRDSRPDFAGPNGMQQFLLRYLANPTSDTTSLQSDMQKFWDSLGPE